MNMFTKNYRIVAAICFALAITTVTTGENSFAQSSSASQAKPTGGDDLIGKMLKESAAAAKSQAAGKATTQANTSANSTLKTGPSVQPMAAMTSSGSAKPSNSKTPKPPPLALSGMAGSEIPGGCGCSFYQVTNLKDAGPLQLRFNTDKKAAIKPGGTLVPMTVTEEHVVRRNQKVKTVSANDKMLVKFKALSGDTSASLVATSERNCQKSTSNNDRCVSVTYQSLLTLATGGATRSYPLWGTCSCPSK